MKGGKTPRGYTIIEVLIVLAASGLMFVIAANFISNKQGVTAFNTGVNELASQIQDTIEEVTNGQYSDVPIDCSGSAGSISATAVSDPAIGTGSNQDCLFLGKVLHFQVDNDLTKYEKISVAGSRRNTGGGVVDNINDASPTAIIGLTATQSVPQNLDVNRVRINGGAIGDSTGIGFLQNFGAEASGDSLRGAALPPTMYYVAGMTAQDTANAETQISSTVAGVPVIQKANRIDLCVSDGSRNAVITIDSIASQRSVIVRFRGNNPCF